MNAIDAPLLELAILLPLVASLLVGRIRDLARAREWSVAITFVTLALVVAAWFLFHQFPADEQGVSSISALMMGRNLLAVDNFNAPLLSLVALIYVIAIITTVPAKLAHFSFRRALASEAITLATFACHEPWTLIALVALGTLLPYVELKRAHQSTRIYVIHMLSAVILLALGQMLIDAEGGGSRATIAASVPLVLGVLLRCGIAPGHCWVTDLFERTSFGAAMLFTLPMTGAYAAVILLPPTAAPWVTPIVSGIALVSSVYAAGMALVQRDIRRFYSFLIVSKSGLVLAGLTMLSPTGLAGGLCVWLSTGIALVGLGLVLRAMEVRVGRLSLAQYHGLYDRAPLFGAFFLFAGLATVGFPGTCGFVGSEMLFDGALRTGIYAGVAVVFTSTLNGITILQAYFRIFTGGRSAGSINLRQRPREQIAIVTLALVILAVGLVPNPFVASRYRVAEDLLGRERSTASRLPGESKGLHAAHELERVDDPFLNTQAPLVHNAKGRKL